MYLSDFTFIEDGNADELEGGLINFDKRRFLAHAIQEIQQFQQTPYCLTEVPLIRDFLLSAQGIQFHLCLNQQVWGKKKLIECL